MPSFLTNKIGPLPTWGWMLAGLGLVVAVTLRRRNAQGATILPTQSLNPDYGTGWPGQGSLGPPPLAYAPAGYPIYSVSTPTSAIVKSNA